MVMSFSEFKALSVDKQAVTLDELRKEYGVNNLVKMWGISTSKLYKLIHELDLPVSKRGRKANAVKKNNNDKPNKLISPPPSAYQGTAITRLAFSLSAEGDGQLLLNRLQPLLAAISASNLKFKVSIIAEEI